MLRTLGNPKAIPLGKGTPGYPRDADALVFTMF